jgi:K+-sensing histidine kinase KdpD
MLGLAPLAVITVICFTLGLNIPAFIHLTVIVLLSLRRSLALSLIAVGCLNDFFISPAFAFRLEALVDGLELAAFLTAAVVVTRVVSPVEGGRVACRRARALKVADLIVDTLAAEASRESTESQVTRSTESRLDSTKKRIRWIHVRHEETAVFRPARSRSGGRPRRPSLR